MVYYGEDLPSYIQIDEDGQFTGFAVDVLLEAVKATNGAIPEPKFKKVPWARAVVECRESPGVGLLSMLMLPSREPHYKWVGPIARMPLALYARKGEDLTINSKSELTNFRIGVVRNTGPSEILSAIPGFDVAKLEKSISVSTLVRLLETGRVDMAVFSGPGVQKILRGMGVPEDVFVKIYDLDPTYVYFSFNLDTDDAYISRLQTGLKALQTRRGRGVSRFEELCRKHWPEGDKGRCVRLPR